MPEAQWMHTQAGVPSASCGSGGSCSGGADKASGAAAVPEARKTRLCMPMQIPMVQQPAASTFTMHAVAAPHAWGARQSFSSLVSSLPLAAKHRGVLRTGGCRHSSVLSRRQSCFQGDTEAACLEASCF